MELDDGSDWSVPCHKPGPLAAGDGIWLRNMSPGVYELWLILVQAGAGAPRAGERVAGVYPRARRGLRVTVLNGTAVNRDYHLWYVDNVGMPGLDHPRFMGVPVQKSLNDLWTTQELLHELRPRAVVEFGTLHGGSALYYAHTLRSVLTADAGAGAGSAGEHGYPFHVLTVDIARENVHARTLAHPAIEVLTASSLSEECARRTAETLHGARAGGGDARVLVLLDSLHTKAHVMAEMELVAPLMRAGDYLIVEDTHHNHHPVPYSDEVGGPGPYEAVEEFERAHPGWFTHDAKRESKFGFTWNPKGYLIRTRVGARPGAMLEAMEYSTTMHVDTLAKIVAIGAHANRNSQDLDSSNAVGSDGTAVHLKPIKTSMKPYKGNMNWWNTNTDGLMYSSRMAIADSSKENEEERQRRLVEQRSKDEAEDEECEDLARESAIAREARREYVLSLLSLTWQTPTHPRLVRKRIVHALTRLARGIPQWQTPKSRALRSAEACGCALANLAENPHLHSDIVRDGIIGVTVMLAKRRMPSRRLQEDTVSALCNLSCTAGHERELVEGGALSLMFSYMFNPNTPGTVTQMLACILLNVTCGQCSRIFEKNEHLFEGLRVMVEFLELKSALTTEHDSIVRNIVLRALCNLASHREYHLRIVEEGVVRAFMSLPLTTGPAKLTWHSRYLVSCVLAHLTRSRSAVEKMLMTRTSNVTDLLILLAKTRNVSTTDRDGSISPVVNTAQNQVAQLSQRCVLLALYRLVGNRESRQSIVEAGATQSLVHLSHLPHRTAKIECMAALWQLSCSETSRVSMLREPGVVELVVNLASSSEGHVMCHCALTLSNFLLEREMHEMLLGKGVMRALMGVCGTEQEQARVFVSQAMYNLSKGEEGCHTLASAGATPVLIDALRTAKRSETRKLCAATLGNLTVLAVCLPGGSADASAAIPGLLDLVADGFAASASRALYNLAVTEDNCRAMLEERGIQGLQQLAQQQDAQSVKMYAAVVSRLSYYDARASLLTGGLVDRTMATLVAGHDVHTQHHCLSVLVNLAQDARTRRGLIGCGAIPTLVTMCASYNEAIRRGCAAAISNVAFDVEHGTGALLEHSGVRAIVVLGLLASNSTETRHFCISALFNLLQHKDKAVLERVMKAGAMFAVATLPLKGDYESAHLAAICVCNVAAQVQAHEHVMSPSTLKAILKVAANRKAPVTQAVCCKALLNLASHSENCAQLAKLGCIPVLHEMAQQAQHAEMACNATLALCLLATDASAMQVLAEAGAVGTIMQPTAHVAAIDPASDLGHLLLEARVVAMYHVAWDPITRALLCGGAGGAGDTSGVAALLSTWRATSEPSARSTLLQALYNLSLSREHLLPLVRAGALHALQDVLDDDRHDRHILQLAGYVLFNCSTEPAVHQAVVNAGGTRMCCALWHMCPNVLVAGDAATNVGAGGCDDVRKIAALTLLNLACGHVNSSRMLNDGAGEVLCTFVNHTEEWHVPQEEAQPRLASKRASLTLGGSGDAADDAVDEAIERRDVRAALAQLPLALCAAGLRNLLCFAGKQDEMVRQHGALDAMVRLYRAARPTDKATRADASEALLILCRTAQVRDEVERHVEATKIITVALESNNATPEDVPSVAGEIDALLLGEIEQETFRRGRGKLKTLGRAKTQELPALRGALRRDARNAPIVRVDMTTVPWARLEIEYNMEQKAEPPEASNVCRTFEKQKFPDNVVRWSYRRQYNLPLAEDVALSRSALQAENLAQRKRS
eukprot:g4884.t1